MEFKITEELKPNNEILEIIKEYEYKVITGKIKTVLRTNLEFIAPTIYAITSPITLTIFEYKVNEISGKSFYIKNHNKKYNLKEIKKMLEMWE